jgi:hypothetical protein
VFRSLLDVDFPNHNVSAEQSKSREMYQNTQSRVSATAESSATHPFYASLIFQIQYHTNTMITQILLSDASYPWIIDQWRQVYTMLPIHGSSINEGKCIPLTRLTSCSVTKISFNTTHPEFSLSVNWVSCCCKSYCYDREDKFEIRYKIFSIFTFP